MTSISIRYRYTSTDLHTRRSMVQPRASVWRQNKQIIHTARHVKIFFNRLSLDTKWVNKFCDGVITGGNTQKSFYSSTEAIHHKQRSPYLILLIDTSWYYRVNYYELHAACYRNFAWLPLYETWYYSSFLLSTVQKQRQYCFQRRR